MASPLGYLTMGSQSVYGLAAVIETSVGNFWNITRSQEYRELASLEANGYVRVGKAGVRERKRYTLTSLGRHAFDLGEDITRSPLLLAMFFGNRVEKATLVRFLRDHRVRTSKS